MGTAAPPGYHHPLSRYLRPFSVRQYFCAGLFGEAGCVIWTKPAPIAGFRYSYGYVGRRPSPGHCIASFVPNDLSSKQARRRATCSVTSAGERMLLRRIAELSQEQAGPLVSGAIYTAGRIRQRAVTRPSSSDCKSSTPCGWSTWSGCMPAAGRARSCCAIRRRRWCRCAGRRRQFR